MASPNISSHPSDSHWQRSNALAELEASLEAAILAAGCRAAYKWALTKMEQGLPQDLIFQVIVVNAEEEGNRLKRSHGLQMSD